MIIWKLSILQLQIFSKKFVIFQKSSYLFVYKYSEVDIQDCEVYSVYYKNYIITAISITVEIDIFWRSGYHYSKGNIRIFET